MLASVVLLLARPVAAQQATAVHPAIMWVVTGGAWHVGRSHGYQRLIVQDGDTSRLTPRLVIQWIEEGANHQLTLRHSQDVTAIEPVWLLGEPQLVPTRQGCRATIAATNRQTGTHAVWIVTVGGPGVYSVSPQR
jgi:hypothetical protein